MCDKCKALEAEVEKLRMQLTACGVAALSNTAESIKTNRLPQEHPFYSASYGDVCRAVDREMELRAEVERLKDDFAMGNRLYAQKCDQHMISETAIANLHNVICERDEQIAALVTALDEATKCTYCDGSGAYQIAEDVDDSYFEECPNCRGKGRFYENITPASRTVVERWLKDIK